jgi:4,5-dihydroxyphthalate decarboxylase
MAKKLNLTLACWDYDRTRALADGRVVPDGIDLNYLSLPVEETFFRMLRYREFDAAELSLSSYSVSLFREDPAFIAIPVFPSRFFRHSCIFVSSASGITQPHELAGRRIGVPEYQMTAPVWIRGILQDEYDLDPASMTYMTGGEEQPGREEKIKLDLPARFHLEPIGPEDTLSEMIAAGRVDAMFTARAPSSFYTKPGKVRRLFENYTEIERTYFQRTGIFPIMHVIVLRRDLYARHPWVAQSLFKAFIAAKQITYDDMQITAALKTSLPWQIAAVEETEQLMGKDWWSYGFAKNNKVIETFLRYHHEQGLSPRRLVPEELFAPETLDAFRI